MPSSTFHSKISYTRSQASMESMRNFWKSKGEDFLKGMTEEVFNDGEILVLRRPFGCDFHISLFGGENTFFFSEMGGHGLSAMFSKSEVDGPHKHIYNKWSFDVAKEYAIEKKEASEVVRREVMAQMRFHLPKEIVAYMVEKGYLEDN